MKKTIYTRIFALALLSAFVFAGFAQDLNQSNLTNTPYSRYGFGKMGSVSTSAIRSMGDIGVVAYSNTFTNLYNPASLTAIDTLTMLVDVGVNCEWQMSDENGKKQTEVNSGLSYFSLHFPLWNRFAGAISLTPYSMVGYYYGAETKEPLDNSLITNDSLFYSNTYQGAGGLQKVMASIGWRPYASKSQVLNLGLNVGYIYGSVSHEGSIYISSGQGQSTYISRAFTAKGLETTLGIQYIRRLSASKSLLIGGTFSPKTPIKIDADNFKYTLSDTISTSEKYNVSSPMKLGFGLSYIEDRKLQAGAEVTFEKWGDVAGLDANLKKVDGIYKNITKFAAGIEYQPSVYSQNYFKTCRYRAGANVKSAFVETFGSQNTEYTASAGMGFPIGIGRRKSLLSLSAEYTYVHPSKSGMLKEQYLNITLGITFNEIMFFRNALY